MPAVLLIAAAVIALVIGVQMVNRAIEFKKRFPPISDAEFLARCQPGTDPEVALKVRKIVAEYFAVEYDRVHPSMGFTDDIGAD